MSLEGLKQIFEIGGVILLFLTFIFGAGALYTAGRLNVEKDTQLRQFDKDLTDNKGRVAGLEQDVANAKAEMARQQTRAATAERSLLELQDRVKIRRLAPEQRKKLVDFLHAPAALVVPKGPIRIQRLIFDETAQSFAVEIKDAFGEGGWSSDDVGKSTAGSNVPVGIIVIVHDARTIPAHAGLIQHALIAADLKPTLGENPGVPEGMVEIMVGIKP